MVGRGEFTHARLRRGYCDYSGYLNGGTDLSNCSLRKEKPRGRNEVRSANTKEKSVNKLIARQT